MYNGNILFSSHFVNSNLFEAKKIGLLYISIIIPQFFSCTNTPWSCIRQIHNNSMTMKFQDENWFFFFCLYLCSKFLKFTRQINFLNVTMITFQIQTSNIKFDKCSYVSCEQLSKIWTMSEAVGRCCVIYQVWSCLPKPFLRYSRKSYFYMCFITHVTLNDLYL